MTWRNIVMAIFGAWFVVSPWALGEATHTGFLWSAVVLGGLTLIGSIWALVDRKAMAWRPYLMALFGLYLGLNPFFFGFATKSGPLWVTMLVGAAMIADGLWQALAKEPLGEGGHTFKKSA